jgi:single-stranded-DNA-specific exonuclease
MSGPVARWKLQDPFAAQKGIERFPQVVATVLAARGITTRQQADLFYKPQLQPDYDPLELPGMHDAITRVRKAIEAREVIALYGDFDVDGVTSVSVLTLGLRALGARTVPYIPDRFTEGYGLNVGAVSKLRNEGAGLLVTADCGISSVEEVAHSNSLGLDVIILDHHTVPEEMPAALAAVNPKRLDSPYPFDELAAVGVSFRFLQVLYEAMGRTLDESELIDLVALGTVVDVAPLEDENRRIVKQGLERMRQGLRPGLDALARVSGTAPDRFESQTLGFQIGPRMNAAGRLKHANIALELMLEENPMKARQLAEQLDLLNRMRQEQTEAATQLADEICGNADDPLIMIGSTEIHAGIVGIVASRLADRRYRPAVVYEQGATTSRASCRSIPAFDIVSAIRKEKDLLVRHGGHRAAAGFTVKNENLPLLRERLMATAAELLDGEELRPLIQIDAEVPLSALVGLEIKGLMAFEPCGHGNRKPVLLSRGIQVHSTKRVGSDQSHLKVMLKDGTVLWPGFAPRRGGMELEGKVDVVYSLTREWRSERVELEIIDIAPSSEGRGLEQI